MTGRLALVLLLSISLAGFAQAQDAADYEREGITYYLGAGSHTSSHMVVGDTMNGTQEDFQGCVHMYLRDRPEVNDAGRIQLLGRYGDEHLTFYFSDFSGDLPDMDGGLAQDILVDGSRTHPGRIQHPAVFAGMAAWGTGELLVENVPYADPVTGSSRLEAHLFVTPDGFRDNTTGAILDADGGLWEPGEQALLGENDWEVHLRVESPADRRQPDLVQSVGAPNGTPGYFPSNEAYSGVYLFDNQRFGSTATIRIDTEAMAPAGDNELRFVFRDPKGDMLDEVILAPALMDPAEHVAEVPLDMFGTYSLQVTGKVSLSRYDVELVQHTPDAFDVRFWWDETVFGAASTQTLWDCQDDVGNPEELVATIIDRVPPPRFDWVPIGFGLAASVLGVVVTGKLIHMSATRK